ncbi:MAG: S9 family peptidase [Polyangiales bacterium]
MRAWILSLSLVGVAACNETPPPASPTPPKAPPPPAATSTSETKAVAAPKPAPPRADTNLLSRKVLFGNPDHAAPVISPDGKRIAFTAPDKGVMNLWVSPSDDPNQAKVVTHSSSRPIRTFYWAFDNKHLLYQNDLNGDENEHVFQVDVESLAERDLTPKKGVRASVLALSAKKPNDVLVKMNDRDDKVFDVHRLDLASGKLTKVRENDQSFTEWIVDNALEIRFGVKTQPAGGFEWLTVGKKPGEYTSFMKVPQEDDITTESQGFDKTNGLLYLADSRGRDKSALAAVDVKTGKESTIFEPVDSDVAGVLLHPGDRHVEAVLTNKERTRWHVLDKAYQADLDALEKLSGGEVEVLSQSLDDKKWTVAFAKSDGPSQYHLWDRTKKKATFLFVNRPELEKKDIPLSKMNPVVIKSRDGLELVSYLTLPYGSDADGDARPDKGPLPMVLFVHGGPWSRDTWRFHPAHQWLQNRGYAVLSVNFRGSTGFGKKFVNAGDHEWGAKMHDDLLDAVKWAIDSKIADPHKVAIMGGSYGGYATLVGLTFTPDVFACGVDIVGPSDLNTLLASNPPYWIPMKVLFAKRIGDPETPEGKKLLDERSPLARAGAITKPLLIGQGANDPRVKQAESDQIVKAMQAKGLPVTYVLFSDEGHGFRRPENSMAFWAIAEIFLAEHLGGAYLPIGDDFKGSSVAVPSGADGIFSLGAALPK